jgi:hypothetical protein
MAYLLFPNIHFHQSHLVAQVAFRIVAGFWAEVPPAQVDQRQFLSASHMSPDTLLGQFVMEWCRQFDF